MHQTSVRDMADAERRVAQQVGQPFRLRLCITLTCWCPTLVALWWLQGGRTYPPGNYTPITPTSSFTESALFCRAAFSSGVSLISMICSMPWEPSLHGTPTNNPLMPYSPSRYAAQGRIFFLSLRIASTISVAAADGA